MELMARGVRFPYGSTQEFLAIKGIEREWDRTRTSALLSVNRLEDSSMSSLIELIQEQTTPGMADAKVARLNRYKEQLTAIRAMGPMKVVKA